MTNWRIVTSGPCFTYVGTVEEVMAHIERSTPLKRGWTRQWEAREMDGNAFFYCHRHNSKGRALDGYTVLAHTTNDSPNL